MSSQTSGRLRFAFFTSFAPAGAPGTAWDQPSAVDFNYLNLDHWITLAQALERAKFDAIFWADHSSAHDVYQGSWAATVREAMQFPIADPMLLAATLIAVTTNLGFAFSSNIIQDHPYSFARRLSTLDHLSRGRIAWNIVTSFQASAWRNLGHDDVRKHLARYEQAEEYVTVIYKLLEGSWEDGAVVRDRANRVFADPEKIHEIHHKGEYYSVPGIHTNEPSPQRVPVLFQAGSSDDGRNFAARNAEAMFIAAEHPRGAKILIDDMQRRLETNGRLTSDLLIFQYLNIIVGSTEEEARRKDQEASEYFKDEANLVFYSSILGADLSRIDLDTPLGDFKTERLQGSLKGLVEAMPNKVLTFRDTLTLMAKNRLVGTPEQIADAFEAYRDVGVTGINVAHTIGLKEAYVFIDQVVPILKARGLMQKEFPPGTFREKLFAQPQTPSGPRLNPRHPAARYRNNNRNSKPVRP